MSIEEILTGKYIWTILISFLIAIVILKIKDKIINKSIKKIGSIKTEESKKKLTYIKLIDHIINYIVIIILFLIILQLFGVDVTSIIAGIGVVSLVAGLALQDALKDIIMGFNIIVDNYFSVGDVIKIGEVEGKVIEVGVKSTKLKDVNNDNILVISNRNINESLKISDLNGIDIPLPYEEDTLKIEKIINEIIIKLKENNDIKEVKYLGINEFGDSAIIYKILLICSPDKKLSTKRFALRTIKIMLDKNNITIPYNQLDIHQK